LIALRCLWGTSEKITVMDLKLLFGPYLIFFILKISWIAVEQTPFSLISSWTKGLPTSFFVGVTVLITFFIETRYLSILVSSITISGSCIFPLLPMYLFPINKL